MGKVQVFFLNGHRDTHKDSQPERSAKTLIERAGGTVPIPGTKVLKCKLQLPVTSTIPREEGDKLAEYWESVGSSTKAFLTIKAWAWGDYVFVCGDDYEPYFDPRPSNEDTDPFIQAKPLAPPVHKKWTSWEYTRTDVYYSPVYRDVEEPCSYQQHYDYNQRRYLPGALWNYMQVRVYVGETHADGELRFHRPDGGLLDLDAFDANTVVTVGGKPRDFKASLNLFGLPLSWDESIERDPNKGIYCSWAAFTRLIQNFDIVQGKDALWEQFLARQPDYSKDDKGVKALENKKGVKENIARIKTEEPLLASFYGWIHEGRTQGGTSNNTLLAAFLNEVGGNYELFKKSLREAMIEAPGEKTISQSRRGRNGVYTWEYKEAKTRRDICLHLPGAREKNEEKRAQKEWNFRKGAREQAIGLGVSPESHPLLLAAIEANEIPLGIFHRAGDALSFVNVEFDLWEKAFAQPGWKEVLCEIAQNASRRSNFERDITPYIAFLFHLPKYLDRHTDPGPAWRTMPKFVQSEWELEMEEVGEGETAKKRSALTPVADNAKRTVTVPYVAMAIHGVQTTYCYSLDYQVFEENTVDRESKTVVTRDLEIKLNGRDDYGLMYYTLTGSARNTGYPAFLIIFERMKSRRKTRVHFHRVHPCRSKDGKPTPACRLVEECYRYMAGNVRAEEIHAQQGDLIFIKTDQKVDVPADAKAVKEFESHAFVPLDGKPIKLVPNTNKSVKNRLGFLVSEGVFKVQHPEHENIKALPAGTYDVRRCKSFEANPKAIWSYTID